MPAWNLRGALVAEAAGVVRRDLALHDGRVTAAAAPGATTIDLCGYAVFPGFVNAHDHLQLNALPRLVGDRPFANSYEWIAAMQARIGDADVTGAVAIESDDRYWHGALKNVLSGATTVAHHDDWRPHLGAARFPVKVVAPYGWCHSLGLADPVWAGSAVRYGPGVEESYAQTPPGARWFIHVAEGTDALAGREVEELDRRGCLSSQTVVIHAVGTRPRDRERIIASGAAVVWCPTSNLATLGATLDPHHWRSLPGFALGTDSRATGAADLLGEMRVAAQHGVSPRELLALVTVNAARSVGHPDCGHLGVGARADLVVVPADARDPREQLPHLTRAGLSAVVRGGRPVVTIPALRDWFDRGQVSTLDVVLDGRHLVVDADLFARRGAAALEPGLAAAA